MFEEEIKKLLKKEVKEEIALEVPPDTKLGDYAFPCFTLAKTLKKNPVQIAKEIASKLKPTKNIAKITATGPYVNFFVNKGNQAENVLIDINYKKEKYGSSDEGKEKIISLDFSSPNIAKPFGIGHLRSTVIGNSLSLMHEHLGYKIVRLNHLGDWGTQFGALIYSYLTWGDRTNLKADPIHHLYDLYTKFNAKKEKDDKLQAVAREWFKKLEDGDKEATKLWAEFRHLSIHAFNKVYEKLGISFDANNGEAFFNDKIESAISLAEKKGITELNDGALIVPLADVPVPAMLRKSDKASTYLARDLAALLYRIKEYKSKGIVYVVGSEQKLHFEQLFAVARKLGVKEDLNHVNFGMYLSTDGKKMSTRKGKLIFMEEVLEDVIDLAKKTIDEKNPELKNKDKVAQQIGVGAVVFGDLVNDRIRDITFDWEKILDLEGDTGPYLQYTYARASSIIRKAKEQKLKVGVKVNFEMLLQPVEQQVVSLLAEFPEKVKHSLNEYKPHILAQHLLATARHFNEFYHSCPCLKEENEELKMARLLLIDCTRSVIKTGLHLLGIESPEEM